jgi:hypothetical protein
MQTKTMTILLIGIMCISPVSGWLMVICHGDDGRIAVEPVIHSHCDASVSCSTDIKDDVNRPVLAMQTDHRHCSDTLAMSSYVFSARKNIKLPADDVFTVYLFHKSMSISSASRFGYVTVWPNELSSFFAPLQTVILLT